MMSEKSRTHPGLYVSADPKNGQEVLYLVRPDHSSVEISRDPILESTVIPTDSSDDWNPPVGSGSDCLTRFMEKQPDGGELGYEVTASGSVCRLSTDPGAHGMHRSFALQPTDHEAIESAIMLLNLARQDIFK